MSSTTVVSSSPRAAGSAAALPALRRHLALCAEARGQWFGLRCIAEGVNRFVEPRFVTTVATVALIFCAVAIAA